MQKMQRILKEVLSRIDFLLPVSLVVVFNVPYFRPEFFPLHDTLSVFQIFSFFYNELFFNGQLAQWLPYSSMGLPAGYYQLNNLTPFSYLFMVIGKVFNVYNTLFLFKLSMVFEQVAFVLGMYVLGRVLYSRRSTVLLICVASVCSLEWLSQISFNFRMFYLFPWVLYLLVRFFVHKKSECLWLSGIVGFFWAVGNTPYFIFLWLFVLTVFCVGMLFSYRPNLKSIFKKTPLNLVALGVCLALCAMYGYFLWHSIDAATFFARGESSAGKVPLEEFIRIAGLTKPHVVLKSMMFGIPTHLPWGGMDSNSIYCGFLIFLFFIWSVLFVRDRVYLAVVIAAFGIICLALNGIFACAVYHFPAMDYYRHTSLVYGLFKVLFLIAAGFGIEDFWRQTSKVRIIRFVWIIVASIFLLDLLRVPQNVAERVYNYQETFYNFVMSLQFSLLVFRVKMHVIIGAVILVVYAVLKCVEKYAKWVPLRNVGNVLVLLFFISVVLFDVVSYRILLNARAHRLPKNYHPLLSYVNAHKLPYRQKRDEAPDLRTKAIISLLTGPEYKKDPARYIHAFNFVQYDPCGAPNRFRTNFLSKGVNAFLESLSQPTNAFYRVMGCSYPKMRLVNNTVMLDSEQEASQVIAVLDDFDQYAILNGKSSDEYIGTPANSAEDSEIAVRDFSANGMTIEVSVPEKDGSWLVYADAFHRGWKARVDGKRTPIYKAYLAFKAIRIRQGKHTVELRFFDGITTILGYIIAIISVLGAGVFCIMVVLMPATKTRNKLFME